MINQFSLDEKNLVLVADGHRIEKGQFLLFKTGNNIQNCIEPGDALQGVVTNTEGVEVLATLRYDGGGIAAFENYTVLNSQSINPEA